MCNTRLWPLAEKCGSMVRYPSVLWCTELPLITKVWGQKMLEHNCCIWEGQLFFRRQHRWHMKQEYDQSSIFPSLSKAYMRVTQLDAPPSDTQTKFWPPKWNYLFLKLLSPFSVSSPAAFRPFPPPCERLWTTLSHAADFESVVQKYLIWPCIKLAQIQFICLTELQPSHSWVTSMRHASRLGNWWYRWQFSTWSKSFALLKSEENSTHWTVWCEHPF